MPSATVKSDMWKLIPCGIPRSLPLLDPTSRVPSARYGVETILTDNKPSHRCSGAIQDLGLVLW